ncbi:hypothetical protein JCM11491_001981 [Sporobolomyces phaffii]
MTPYIDSDSLRSACLHATSKIRTVVPACDVVFAGRTAAILYLMHLIYPNGRLATDNNWRFFDDKLSLFTKAALGDTNEPGADDGITESDTVTEGSHPPVWLRISFVDWPSLARTGFNRLEVHSRAWNKVDHVLIRPPADIVATALARVQRDSTYRVYTTLEWDSLAIFRDLVQLRGSHHVPSSLSLAELAASFPSDQTRQLVEQWIQDPFLLVNATTTRQVQCRELLRYWACMFKVSPPWPASSNASIRV